MFRKGFDKKSKPTKPGAPGPNDRPAVLYPCVPDDFDWPDKMGGVVAAPVKMPSVPAPKAPKPNINLSPKLPRQPNVLPKTLGNPMSNSQVSPTKAPGIPLPNSKLAGAKPKKPLFGKLSIRSEPDTIPAPKTGPQMETQPLGASMPNQGTGGGIAGGYGSN